MTSFSLFDTPIGACAVAWNERGIVGVQLPEGDEEETRRQMHRRFPIAVEAEVPAEVAPAVDAVVRLLKGSREDLGGVALNDEGVPSFDRRVYELTRRIPPGETRTYGELAEALGDVTLARAVGQALGRNPFAPIVPCHRVVAADGRMGGFSAAGGLDTKRRLLEIEGAPIAPMLPWDGEAS